MSATPLGNSRTSSGAPSRLCATTCLVTISCMPASLPLPTRPGYPYLLVGQESRGVENGLPMGDDALVADTTTKPETDTATRILDAAERLVQIRGFNGFSY